MNYHVVNYHEVNIELFIIWTIEYRYSKTFKSDTVNNTVSDTVNDTVSDTVGDTVNTLQVLNLNIKVIQ